MSETRINFDALIPVNRSKQPLVKWKRFQSKLPTPREVAKWRDRFNGRIAGWALPTGKVSGIIALDFDGEIGVNTLQRLGLKPNIKTPGGGYHVWIESPDFKTRTGAFDDRWPGLELKGDGGYVVVYGRDIESKHSGSEPHIGDYEIISEIPITIWDLPDKELAAFITRKKEASIEDEIARLISGAIDLADKGRNNAGFWLACQLRDLGLSKDETTYELLENFLPETPEGNHAYTEEEIIASVASAFSKDSDKKDSGKKGPTNVSLTLLGLLNEQQHAFWHSEENSYLTTPEGINLEVYSKPLKEYLIHIFYSNKKQVLPRKALEELMDLISAKGKNDGNLFEPEIRIAWYKGTCYVDNLSTYYEISSKGYREVAETPIKFLRSKLMGPIPKPEESKDDGWNILHEFVNVEDREWPLFKSLILAAFMPGGGSYPIGVFTGSHGTGKSTAMSIIIDLVDPRYNIDAIRGTLPRDVRDLSILAKSSFVLSFDNESHITKTQSDMLAKLSTGGMFATRELYSNSNSAIFSHRRLTLINSIGDIVTESDLLDRSVIIEFPQIRKGKHLSEIQFWKSFKEKRPYILHSIFESVVEGCNNFFNSGFNSSIFISENIRLEDYVRWSLACGIGSFIDAYSLNNLKGPLIGVNGSLMGTLIFNIANREPNQNRIDRNEAMIKVLERQDLEGCTWIGRFSELFAIGEAEMSGWYKSTNGAMNGYKRVKADLAALGIQTIDIEKENQLWIGIRK